jgi:phosphohistidine phosphatase
VKLYVMRHGPAEDGADSGDDGDRALTVPGRQRVREVARVLVEVGEEPAEIITSPLVRAVQTAEIVAVDTKLGDRGGSVRTRRELSPGGPIAQLARRIASQGRKRVMFVGHEPDLSGLVSSLLGKSFGQGFDKAGVVGLHVSADTGHGRLRFVLDPRSLELERPPR